jgi:hypothetical protein
MKGSSSNIKIRTRKLHCPYPVATIHNAEITTLEEPTPVPMGFPAHDETLGWGIVRFRTVGERLDSGPVPGFFEMSVDKC